MLFKDLEVGDTLYVNNPKKWNEPIKESIGKIVSNNERLDFYAENGDFLGAAMPDCSKGIGIGSMIFADFEAFKKYWVDYHKKNVEQIEAKMKKINEALGNARHNLTMANLM